MKDDKHKHEGQTGRLAKKNPGKDPRQDPRQDSRQDRLKLALRENLKRRKSQAKGRSNIASTPFNGDDVPPHHASKKKPGR
jgi:hypothetical protein